MAKEYHDLVREMTEYFRANVRDDRQTKYAAYDILLSLESRILELWGDQPESFAIFELIEKVRMAIGSFNNMAIFMENKD